MAIARARGSRHRSLLGSFSEPSYRPARGEGWRARRGGTGGGTGQQGARARRREPAAALSIRGEWRRGWEGCGGEVSALRPASLSDARPAALAVKVGFSHVRSRFGAGAGESGPPAPDWRCACRERRGHASERPRQFAHRHRFVVDINCIRDEGKRAVPESVGRGNILLRAVRKITIYVVDIHDVAVWHTAHRESHSHLTAHTQTHAARGNWLGARASAG